MTCRLLSSFTITAGINDKLRIGGVEMTITAGTYFMSDDGAADDFVAQFVSDINSFSGETWTLDIQGMGVSLPSTAEGRTRLAITTGFSAFTIRWSHANTTFDPRIIGWRATSGDTTFDPGATAAYTSPDVHRYGWYPQLSANDDTVLKRQRGAAQYGSQGKPTFRRWGAEHDWMRLRVDGVPRLFVHEFGAEDQDTVDAYLVTLDDPNCAYERFILDLDEDSEVFYYPDTADTATRKGRFKLSESSPNQWTDPLALSRVMTPNAGELWSVVGEWETSQ